MKRILPLGLFLVLFGLFSNAQGPMPGDLVGSHQGGSGPFPAPVGLMVINPITGLGSSPLFHSTFIPYTDIDFRYDGMLFCEQANGFDTLLVYDPGTGTTSVVGKHPLGAITGLEFVGSTLYGTFISVSGGSADLIVIDQNDASFISVLPTGLNRITGLAYDPLSRIMYGSEVIGQPPAQCNLVTIDLTTGASSLVGPIGYIVGGMDFDRSGTLYGATSRHGLSPGHLITIDTSTGAGTVIGDTGYGAISGISFYPPESIPVNYGLVIAIFLGLALLRFAYLIHRR